MSTACSRSLSARSASTARDLTITASSGAVVLPDEADRPDRGAADRRLADVRGQGPAPGSAQRQTHDVSSASLREREPGLGDAPARGRAARRRDRPRANLDAEALDSLVRAAELHDIGKVAIPDKILHKPRPLDDDEWELMRTHTTIGERILAVAPAMGPVAELVRSSHERWDGDGYPDGLAGEQIPLGARIISVCDAFEAMTEERPYRRAMAPPRRLAELRAAQVPSSTPVWSSCSPSMSFRGSAPIPPPGCRRRPSRPGSPRRSPRPVRRAQGCSQAANLPIWLRQVRSP